MEIVKNNKKAIILAGATAVAAGLYLLVKKALKEEAPLEVDLAQVVPNALTEEEKKAIVDGIRVQYDGINLTMATISEIIEATIKLITPEFAAMTWKDRNERRANKEDLKKYVQLCEAYTKAVDKLISESQMGILDYLEIPDSIWENSNSYYMSQGSQDLMLLHASIHSRLKMNMKSRKFLLKDEFLSVLNRQIELLEEEAHNVRQIQSYTSNPRKGLGVVHSRVNDSLAAEFGVEDEDFMSAMKRYKSTPEFQPLFNRLQKVTKSLAPMGARPKRR